MDISVFFVQKYLKMCTILTNILTTFQGRFALFASLGDTVCWRSDFNYVEQLRPTPHRCTSDNSYEDLKNEMYKTDALISKTKLQMQAPIGCGSCTRLCHWSNIEWNTNCRLYSNRM